jgi:hypothetical protein
MLGPCAVSLSLTRQRLPLPAWLPFPHPQEELEQWAATARQKEGDALALERYRRQDEARVKELGMQLERAAREAHQGKRDLEEQATEAQVGWSRVAGADC